MRRSSVLFLMLITGLCTFQVFAQNIITEVYIISSLHRLHSTHHQYTYDTLYSYVKKISPDVIGVEIRPEDIDSTTAFLEKMYPLEMYTLRNKYQHLPVYGFDWLGDEIVGKSVPEDYFQQLIVPRLQNELRTDSSMISALNLLSIVSVKKTQIIYNSSMQEMHDGRYELVNEIYYRQMKELFEGTPYQPLYEFYEKRDENIANNIISTIQMHPGKRLLFVTGGDHRAHILYKLQEILGESIKIMPIQ